MLACMNIWGIPEPYNKVHLPRVQCMHMCVCIHACIYVELESPARRVRLIICAAMSHFFRPVDIFGKVSGALSLTMVALALAVSSAPAGLLRVTVQPICLK